jgi:heat shock protein 90kDa beta
MGKIDEGDSQQKRSERKERAVREREEKVRAERDRLEVDIGRSRMGMNQEEGEREFK